MHRQLEYPYYVLAPISNSIIGNREKSLWARFLPAALFAYSFSPFVLFTIFSLYI